MMSCGTTDSCHYLDGCVSHGELRSGDDDDVRHPEGHLRGRELHERPARHL